MTELISQYVAAHGHPPGVPYLVQTAGVTAYAAGRALREYRAAHPDLPLNPKSHRRGGEGRAAVQVTPQPTAPTLTYEQAGEDRATLESRGRIQTLEELLVAGKVDTKVWRCSRFTVNSYEGFSKDDAGNVIVTPLFQVKASLEKSQESADLHALKEEMLAAIAAHAPTYAPITRSPVRGGHILVLSPADAHIGKGAWAAETGADMGIPEAVQAVRESVEALTADALPLGIAEIVLIVGNDLLQVDSSHGTTWAHTAVDTAGSYRQALAAARDLMVELAERLTVHAPVRLVIVPGNHDRESALHLGDYLAAWFRNAPDVTVDAAPTHRKYLSRGKVLLGFTHGNAERHADLPQIMAQEQAQAWAGSVCREWITGHYHKKAARHFLPLTETGGVIVRTVSALSRSDLFHAINGYISTPAAEAFVYHPEQGLKAQFHHRPVSI